MRETQPLSLAVILFSAHLRTSLAAEFASSATLHTVRLKRVQLQPYSNDLETTAYAQTVQTREPEFTNSGDSDASPEGTPSQFLLVRNLEPTVTEELLAKGVSKLYKPNPNALPAAPSSKKAQAKVASTTGDANLGAREGSIRRVLLVRDRRTDESWRYGFAEFSSVEVGFTMFLQGILFIRL